MQLKILNNIYPLFIIDDDIYENKYLGGASHLVVRKFFKSLNLEYSKINFKSF